MGRRHPWKFTTTSGSVPVVVSVDYGVVDMLGGGERVVVEVDDSTGLVSIAAGGIDFTDPQIDNATHVSGIPGVHAAGLVDVVVTNGNGPSTTGTNLIRYWSPREDDALQNARFMPGGYAITGTQGVDAVGIWQDETANNYDATSLPTGGFQVPLDTGGYPTFEDFIGLIIPASLNGDLTNTDNGAIVTIGAQDAPLDPTLANYQNECLVCGDGATAHLIVDDAGFRIGGYDGIGYLNETATAGILAATSYVLAGKWDTLGAYRSVDGDAWSAVVPYNAPQVSFSGADMGATTYLGMGYGGLYVWRGPIKMVVFYPSAASVDNTKLALYQDWALQRGLVV